MNFHHHHSDRNSRVLIKVSVCYWHRHKNTGGNSDVVKLNIYTANSAICIFVANTVIVLTKIRKFLSVLPFFVVIYKKIHCLHTFT